MSDIIKTVKENSDARVYAVFEKLAGKKLDKAAELAVKLHSFEEKSMQRAMADALEQLNLLRK